MSSILAGFLIAMGAIINLKLGGVIGAFMFSLGLITILTFKLDLFTGKAGLLTTGEITAKRLVEIWFGNLIGALICGILVSLTPLGLEIAPAAVRVVELRSSQPAITNCVYGIFCGMLMYIAVTGFKKTGNYLFAVAPVAFFILCGFNHCVADMFYCSFGATELSDLSSLAATTIGNVIGTNVIPHVVKCLDTCRNDQ